MNDRATLLSQLETCLGAGAVLQSKTDIDGFVEDFKGRYRGEALCVVQPNSTGKVAAVVRLCAGHGVSIIPQGGNTSLCGGSVPSEQQGMPVVLSLSRMRAIRSIDVANGTMVVEAGCILKTVQDAAAQVKRLYPVSLGGLMPDRRHPVDECGGHKRAALRQHSRKRFRPGGRTS